MRGCVGLRWAGSLRSPAQRSPTQCVNHVLSTFVNYVLRRSRASPYRPYKVSPICSTLVPLGRSKQTVSLSFTRIQLPGLRSRRAGT